MKQPRQTGIEKIREMQAKAKDPKIDTSEITNLLFGARHGLRALAGQDLVNVSLSIARVEAVLAASATPSEPPAKD